MMNTSTAAYIGITTGLMTPDFVKIINCLLPEPVETVSFKYFDELPEVDGAKL